MASWIRFFARRANAGDFTSTPAVLLVGDAADVLEEIRRQLPDGTRVIDRRTVGASDVADLVVIALRTTRGSSLARAHALSREYSGLQRADAACIVIEISGAARLAPPRLLKLAGAEMLYQIALHSSGQRYDRRLRDRVKLAALDVAGVHVFRVRRIGSA